MSGIKVQVLPNNSEVTNMMVKGMQGLNRSIRASINTREKCFTDYIDRCAKMIRSCPEILDVKNKSQKVMMAREIISDMLSHIYENKGYDSYGKSLKSSTYLFSAYSHPDLESLNRYIRLPSDETLKQSFQEQINKHTNDIKAHKIIPGLDDLYCSII
ncbi:hypothetical protein TVAG_237970 [Trichomonas vaginalis G3]|uniref:Uncharacterized protein n=1 Tax=Trichomonas vaginalis (strain ATCC PRA-98 / G3) TaxID=412133 RepID=A2DCZ7_TRIV3|nr:hypothetical protein TVAGG3_0606220 [Trichomonas vaginalis G3]EAY21771.1 hypothetical protein TVAG_237970 [Trichomonas vaginalis G3]KAI5524257.1 hypothetical protein TVAGG3_0606220 [Trichomonas vaginalis G3]|eukprot:XP_001582757.1 hypothetical protein [Trichomonas vaginalis G3]